MLITKNLSFAYPSSPAMHFPDVQCGRGEHWLLLGQSGSGKTTLLHLLGGLLRPKSGTVQVGDTEIQGLQTAVLDRFRGKNIGIIFQKPHFVQSLSVEENLQIAQYLANEKPDKKRIQSLLESLNLGHKLTAKTNDLSEGEKQRVSIARALVNRPVVILADEPTSALDDFNCAEVVKLLENQAKEQNATLLIVTHDTRLKAYFNHQISLV